MSKTVTLRLDEEVYRRFKRSAETDHRSLANWLETSALRHLEECQFVSDAEMAEIRRDRNLVGRVKQARRDWHERKGRYVAGRTPQR